ncbi:MAG TPA: C25 family cysteine peptidase [Bacteroidia bacterium]|nr:C25 family cysteine peptidase [Bacteroidia bacterium]
MNRFTPILLFLVLGLTSSAQQYGNEWIRVAQPYFKFPIHKNGVYRIDSTTLASAYDLNSLDPRNIQVFLRGKEQFLYIQGESDGKINTGDYIEFYADKSTAPVDSMVYTHISYLPNPYGPLFNDTLYAFITVNGSTANKRFQLETDTSSALYPASDHCFTEQVFSNPVNYNYAEEYVKDVPTDPRYTQCEGKGMYLPGNSYIQMGFAPIQIYTLNPHPVLVKLVCSGNSKNFTAVGNDHELTLHYKNALGNPVQIFDTLFYAYAPVRKTFTLNATDIGSSSNFSLSSPVGAAITTSANASLLHYLSLFYPQTLHFNNLSTARFYCDDNTTSNKSFYNFNALNFSVSSQVMLFDLSNGRRIKTVLNPPYVRAVIPNGGGRKYCVIAAEQDTVAVNKLIPVNGNGYFTRFNSSPVSNPFIIIYHKSLFTSAQAYQVYRSGPSGGSFDVIMADIQELYEQFAYGVNKHPAAIRGFLRFLKDSLSVPPNFVLLIGKGMEQQYLTPAAQNENLVPTMGIPSSDHLLSSSLGQQGGNNLVPEIPIGRLAALDNLEVSAYLSKVQEHEHSAPAEWKKTALHFIGSNDETELGVFSYFMNTYSLTASDTSFGASVLTFSKNTSAPVQSNLSDSIVGAMSRSASLINFFGHGATQNLGMALEDPYKFNNAGRYPFFLSNSCYSGNVFIHGIQNSVSQNYVFAKQRGSIGFIATTTESFDSRLHQFTSKFYTAFCRTKYNYPIGEVIREAILNNSTSPDSLTRMVGLQEVLHGDPSIRVSPGIQPDYQLSNKDVRFDTKTYADSIGIYIRYLNSGKAIRDSFAVHVIRRFPNGDTMMKTRRVNAAAFRDSLSLFMALDFNRGVGLNTFQINLDALNEIQESDETNNISGTLDFLITGNDLIPVYPYNYAIVPLTSSITLKASTSDPFAPSGDYLFQLDTNATFSKPLQSTRIKSKGGVMEWNVNLNLPDSTVYFWRVSRDSLNPEKSFLWKTSSFQTIGNKQGWAQAHFDQFREDTYRYLIQNKLKRQFEFQKSLYAIFCRTGNVPEVAWENLNFYFNGIKMSEFSCSPNGWNFVVFDSLSAQPQVAKVLNLPTPSPGQYNNCMCSAQDQYYFGFGATNPCGLNNWKNDMENFINAIAPNNYVLAYSIGYLGNSAQVSSYPPSLLNAFKSIGADLVLSGADSLPRIIFGRKGMSQGQAHENLGKNRFNALTQSDSISTRWYSGSIASTLVGPSSNWRSLHWKMKSLEPLSHDSSVLKLIGIRSNGQEDTLYTFVEDSSDVLDLAYYISAQTHPHLKLVVFMRDQSRRTAPQLKRWQVLYDEAPECALNPLKGFSALNDTLMEGDEAKFVVPIENIGTTDFKDSLLITYWLEDAGKNTSILPYKLKGAPFKAGQIILDTLRFNTLQNKGDNALWIHVNPVGHPKYQNEYQQFNNIGRFPFRVLGDITNPLLDVTFDGRRILNGDIVSAKPEILISLRDENAFLALNDTGHFVVTIRAPGKSNEQRLYFARDLLFTPASLPKNSCSILYKPELLQDGTYSLGVQASDRSNNSSGSKYQISFEVNNKPGITQVLNYPNPFSTSTRFVFTLTGSEIPEVFTIQIMTVSGKLVKEISRAELGDIHIGRNITSYAWDGRDNFGDKLANGVYLYRVICSLNGNSMEHNSSGADAYFSKEFGKLVILR